MSLTLFEHPLSPYARKVKICLYEKGLEFEHPFISPDASPDSPLMQAWVRSSPRMEVPTLLDGDFAVSDSTVILEYLEERFPDPPLQSPDPRERARIRMLEELCDGEYEAVNWGLMEVLVFQRATGSEADALVGRAAEQISRLQRRLELELNGRSWMSGDEFGRGDAAVIPHISGSANFGFEISKICPRLKDWFERSSERDSVRRDTADVESWMAENLAGDDPTASLPKVRQYRDHRLEWMMKSGGVDIVLAGLENGSIAFAKETE